jgi:hypothetical protein
MDPSSPDTDGDGLSDWFEDHFRADFDPVVFNVWDQGTDGAADDDHDGLNNFEEAHLGTNPKSADTDKDGIPDDIELYLGTDPLTKDAQGDPDGDFVPTLSEVLEHTDPLSAEGSSMRTDRGYRPTAITMPNSIEHGVRCYSFSVDNISLAHTLKSVDRAGRVRPAGSNSLDVLVIQQPVLDPSASSAEILDLLPFRMMRSAPWIVFGNSGVRDPQSVELHVTPDDFTP